MNILVKEFTNEMNKKREQPKVTSFYKYKLNDPYNLDHNNGFIPKYNLKVWNKPISHYNDNKYNLKRENKNYELAYKTDSFTPDSYYQYNLEGMTNDRMRLINHQTELELSNDFNRRIRNDDTGETLQEIKAEDDERTTSFKTLLTEYNKNYSEALNQDDKDEVTNKYEEDKYTENKKYNKPTIMKVPENIKFNKVVEKLKKTAKIYDNLKLTKGNESDFINQKMKDYKKTFFREEKQNKELILDEMNEHNIKMGTAILENKTNAKKIQKAGRKYIKKVQNQKIEQDNINKEYLSSIFPQNEEFSEKSPYQQQFDDTIQIDSKNVTKIDNLTVDEVRQQITEICKKNIDVKLSPSEKIKVNKILINNGFQSLGATAINKQPILKWLSDPQVIQQKRLKNEK